MSECPESSPNPPPGRCPFLAGTRTPTGRVSTLPRKTLSLFAWYRLMRQDSMALIPDAAFEEEILESKFLWARGFLINQPEGIRRVLRDNAANYPKTADVGRMLEPVFGKGLLTMEGDTWLRHRRLMAGSFDQRSIDDYAPIMTAAAATLAEDWARLPPGADIDVSAAMMATTARIIMRTMFSSESEKISDRLAGGMEAYEGEAMPNILDLLHFPDWLAGAKRRRISRRTFHPVDRLLQQIVDQRVQAGNTGPDDLLGRLLRFRDDTGQGLSAHGLRDQMVSIFFGGHETSALALSWSWYLLSLHPAAEAKLQAELQSVLNGRAPTAADVPRLTYATMVIQESLRLYPPVFALSSRRALADDEVCGRRIPAGSYVSIVPWALHRHRRLWEEPDRFDPERFSPARSEGRSRYAYIPFSAGPRVCIGPAFAMTEGVLILATLAQRFRLRLSPGQAVATRALITLRPRQAIKMRLEKLS